MPDFLFAEFATQNINSGTKIVQTSGRDAVGQAPGRYIADALATAALQAAHPRLVARSSNNRYFRAMPEGGSLGVDLAGARADGFNDDGPAMRAARAYAAATGIDCVDHQARTYRVERIPPSEQAFASNPPIMLLPRRGGLQAFSGARLVCQNGGRGLVYHPENAGPIIDLPLAQDVTSGSRSVRLIAGAATQLTIGDEVLWQFGELPYDTLETPDWDFARITAIAGDVVTLDRPVPGPLNLAAVSGQNKRLRELAILNDCTIRDLVLAGSGVEDGISLTCARRIRIEAVGGQGIGAGTVVAQYCDGLTILDCWQDGTSLAQISFGAAFAFAESRNCVLVRPRARGTLSLVKAEAGAEVTVIGGHFENTITGGDGSSLGPQVAVIAAVGRSSVSVQDLSVSGFGGYRLVETSNGQNGWDGAVTLSGTTRLKHPDAPYSIPLRGISGVLDMTLAGQREIYDFARLRRWRRRFALRDGEYLYAYGPAGLLTRARAYATPGLAIGDCGQLTGFYLGRAGDNGGNLAGGAAPVLAPGQDVEVPCYAGLVGGAQWERRHAPLAILCTTAPTAGLDAANAFVEFEGWLAADGASAAGVSEADYRSEGDGRDPFEALFRSCDLPPVSAGSTIVLELVVPAMAASDFIESVRLSGGFAGLELRGCEARDGSIALTIANPTPIAIDRAAADLAIAFFKLIGGS